MPDDLAERVSVVSGAQHSAFLGPYVARRRAMATLAEVRRVSGLHGVLILTETDACSLLKQSKPSSIPAAAFDATPATSHAIAPFNGCVPAAICCCVAVAFQVSAVCGHRRHRC